MNEIVHNKYLRICFWCLWSLNVFFVIHEWITIAIQRCKAPDAWGISEFLINYQGGFVRRGLLGEVLYHVCLYCSCEPRYVILPLCFLFFAVFCLLLFKIGKTLHASFLAIPTFYCLFGAELIRKDYMFMVIAFSALALYKKIPSSPLRSCVATFLLILALNLHEAIFFITAPAYFLVVFSDSGLRRSLKLKVVHSLILIATMGFLCLSKGSAELAEKVSQSWQIFYPEAYAQLGRNSIGALSWGLSYAARQHLIANFHCAELPFCGPFLRVAALFIVLYLMTRITLAYHWKNQSVIIHKFIYIATLHFIALIPMLTILSCDFQRVVFYWTGASLFSLYLLRDTDIIGMGNSLCQKYVEKLHRLLSVSPSGKLAYVLLLFFSIPYMGNGIFVSMPAGYGPPVTRIFTLRITHEVLECAGELLQTVL